MFLHFPPHIDKIAEIICFDLERLFAEAVESRLQFMQMRGVTDPYDLAQIRQDYISEFLPKQQALLDKYLDVVPVYLAEKGVSDDEFEQAWALMGGIWNNLEFERIRAIVKLQKDYPEVLEVAKVLGRIADDEGNEKVPLGGGNMMSVDHSAPSDIEGVTVGNDLSSMLPTEMAQMVDEDLNGMFVYKFATRNLQNFRYKSQIMNPSHKLQMHKARQKGPMVICLDTSGSMAGVPERISHSLIVKLLQLALRQDRDFLLIAFSYMAKAFEVRKNRARLLDFFRKPANGDTDVSDMLNMCIGTLMSKPEFMSADVCLVSDYKMPVAGDALMKRILDLREAGTRFYGLQIGETSFKEWPKYFDRIWNLNYKMKLRPSYLMK